jgi:hypothetical protein
MRKEKSASASYFIWSDSAIDRAVLLSVENFRQAAAPLDILIQMSTQILIQSIGKE